MCIFYTNMLSIYINNNSNIKIITIDIIVQLLIINKKSSIIQDIQYIVFFI